MDDKLKKLFNAISVEKTNYHEALRHERSDDSWCQSIADAVVSDLRLAKLSKHLQGMEDAFEIVAGMSVEEYYVLESVK